MTERAYTNDEIAELEGLRASIKAIDDAPVERYRAALAVLRGDPAQRSAPSSAGTKAPDDLVARLREWSNYDDPPGVTLDSLLNGAAAEIEQMRGDIEKLKDPVVVHINTLRGGIAKLSEAQIKHLYPEVFADLERERDEARQLVTEANNSLYGSQGYFHSLNGAPFDKYHLSRGIEDLKATARSHPAVQQASVEGSDDLEVIARSVVTEWIGMFDPPPHIDFQQSEMLQGAIISAMETVRPCECAANPDREIAPPSQAGMREALDYIDMAENRLGCDCERCVELARSYLTEARAALQSPSSSGQTNCAQWMSIETAPRDGTKILLKFDPPFHDTTETGVAVGCMTTAGNWWLSCVWASSGSHREPIAWAPIPPYAHTPGANETEGGR